MAYADHTDAIDLYDEEYVLTSVTHGGSPDLDKLDVALVKASSLMDSYLGVEYDVPLTTVPDIVVNYCIDIGIHFASSDAGTGTEEKRKRYDDALAWLKAIAKGDAIIPGIEEASASDSAVVEISGPTRIFSRTTMGGL